MVANFRGWTVTARVKVSQKDSRWSKFSKTSSLTALALIMYEPLAKNSLNYTTLRSLKPSCFKKLLWVRSWSVERAKALRTPPYSWIWRATGMSSVASTYTVTRESSVKVKCV